MVSNGSRRGCVISTDGSTAGVHGNSQRLRHVWRKEHTVRLVIAHEERVCNDVVQSIIAD